MHSTNNGTAPTSTTAYASLSVCLAIYDKAQAAASLTLGSNSSRQTTRLSNAPLSTTAYANYAECLATALNTNAAAFL